MRTLALACIAGALFASSAVASAPHELAAHTWTTVSTAHVEVLTDAGLPVAQRMALRLEDMRSALARAAPSLVAEVAPVQALVFRDEHLAATLSPRWRGQRDEVSGFFQAATDRRRLFMPLARDGSLNVLQHEYTHALLDAAMPEVPLWLNEGLAEYFSTFEVEGTRARAGAPIRAHLEWLGAHDLIPLRQLFAITNSSPEYHEGDRRGTFYAQSWLLVHMLLSGSESDLQMLEHVLAEVRAGRPFDEAFRAMYGDLSRLERELVLTIDKSRFEVRVWTLPEPAGGQRRRVNDRVSAAEPLASIGCALLGRQPPQREDAEAYLREALAIDGGHPGACAGMAWLLTQRGRHDEARRWADRALERDPVQAPVVRAFANPLLLAAQEQPGEGARRAAATLVRGAITRALRSSPDDPELESLLARTYVIDPGSDPEPAYPHAVRAAEALPGRHDVLLDLLSIAAMTGREEEAARLFAAHFRDPGNEHHALALRGLLAGDVRAANALIAKGDVAGAEARMRAARERVAGEPGLAQEADGFLAQLRQGRDAQQRSQERVSRENAAIAEYNAAVQDLNAQRFAEAAAGFRRAAAGSDRAAFRREALALALRMDLRVRGQRAVELANAGRVAEALAIFQAMDRTRMNAEDARWYDRTVAQLKRMRGR